MGKTNTRLVHFRKSITCIKKIENCLPFINIGKDTFVEVEEQNVSVVTFWFKWRNNLTLQGRELGGFGSVNHILIGGADYAPQPSSPKPPDFQIFHRPCSYNL